MHTFPFESSSGSFKPHTLARNVSKSINASGAIQAFGKHVYDAVLLVPTCKSHSKMLLKRFNDAFYLPFFPLKLGASWMDQVTFHMDSLCSVLQLSTVKHKFCFLQLNQFVLPFYCDIVHQLVIRIQFEECLDRCASALTEHYRWFKFDDVSIDEAHFWGPEPFLYLNSPLNAKCSERSIRHEIVPTSKKWTLIQSLKFTHEDINLLFADYLSFCYPSLYMNQIVLDDYLARRKLTLTVNSKSQDFTRLFNSFCHYFCSYVSFKDVTFALLALDRNCVHGGIGGELRCRYIFRYYAKKGANAITFPEIVQLHEDILVATQPDSKPKSTESSEKSQQLYKKLGLKSSDTISMVKFFELVGGLIIRGTSPLYRCSFSPVGQILNIIKDQNPLRMAEMNLDNNEQKSSTNKCRPCMQTPYTLHSEVILSSSLNKYTELHNILRQYSTKLYGFPAGHNSKPKWADFTLRSDLMKQIIKLCQDVRAQLLKSAPIMIKCTSPLYIFGDVHGNFRDLMIYDHLFWRQIDNVQSCLFLGDYVDRGDHSVECALILFCLKMSAPDRIHLLRGNHEVRTVQKQFTFYHECIEKFGDNAGATLWEEFNAVFDCLPLCALVDEKIYCAHGGIPTSLIRLEDLYRTPVPLSDPIQCPAAWEILWNDPVMNNEYNALRALYPQENVFPLSPPGHLPNLKRGTAFYYSEEAVDRFLAFNRLSLIVRAHEVVPPGFHFSMDGKVTTIFSCSNYCGACNESAVVLLDGGKMRTIQIETHRPFKAT